MKPAPVVVEELLVVVAVVCWRCCSALVVEELLPLPRELEVDWNMLCNTCTACCGSALSMWKTYTF